MKQIIVGIFFLGSTGCLSAQDAEGLLDRLQGYKEAGNYYFNADGVDIACVTAPGPFTASNVAKSFEFAHVKPKRLKSDPGLGYNNYYEPGEILRAPNLSSSLDYYFLEDSSRIAAFTFISNHGIDQEFERTFIKLFLDRKLPNEIYQPEELTRGNFAGRELNLPKGCAWAGATDLRCSLEQLRWSSFKSEEMAQGDKQNHLKLIEAEGNDITGKEVVDVIFEEQEIKALRFTLITAPDVFGRGILKGSEFFVAYIIVAPVRGEYITCLIIHRSSVPLPKVAAQIITLK